MKKNKSEKEKKERKKFKDDIKQSIAKLKALPFVADIKDKNEVSKRGKGRDFWDIRPTGDYIIDCNTGRQYGALALKFMREEGDTPFLTQIVFDMMKNTNSKNKGIEVGFLHFIASAAMHCPTDPLILAAYQQKRADELIKSFLNR